PRPTALAAHKPSAPTHDQPPSAELDDVLAEHLADAGCRACDEDVLALQSAECRLSTSVRPPLRRRVRRLPRPVGSPPAVLRGARQGEARSRPPPRPPPLRWDALRAGLPPPTTSANGSGTRTSTRPQSTCTTSRRSMRPRRGSRRDSPKDRPSSRRGC